MSIRETQSLFVQMVGKLIEFAYSNWYQLTFGDTYATTGHKEGSFHYKRLAVDFNLFKGGTWLTDTESHRPLGEFWESLGGTWGGRFNHPDGNHYSLGE